MSLCADRASSTQQAMPVTVANQVGRVVPISSIDESHALDSTITERESIG
jgi:hypothetical protein